MTNVIRASSLALVGLALSASARAQVMTFTDEAAFLAALAAQSIPTVHEGFEDNAIWGGVRSSIVGGAHTAPSIHGQGVTWIPSTPNSEITTGTGPALGGLYGFYQFPHGDPVNGINDGFGGIGDVPMVAIGGWIETNTPPAKVELSLDGVAVHFGGPTFLSTQHAFFGAIDLSGFSQFEFLETEAMPGDWKLMFSDDFTYAFGGTIIDCNQNGLTDSLDILSGTSADCNLNLVPDECEIAVGSAAPGGPFYCTENCDFDCNDNAILDTCEVLAPVVYPSGALSPIGDGFPQSFTILAPPSTFGPVTLDFRARANLGGNDEYIDVDINGVAVGTVFVSGADDCPEFGPDTARLVLSRAEFNGIVAGGNAAIGLTASTEVDANDCTPASWIEVDVTLMTPSSADLNANGIPDSCEGLGTSYCVAAPNASFAGGAHIYVVGSLVAADNNVRLLTADVPPGTFGVHFYGPAQVQVPLGYGFRCVGGAAVRLYAVQANTSGFAYAPIDLTLPPALGSLFSGVTTNFQLWYRDNASGVVGFNFSDAVSVTFQ